MDLITTYSINRLFKKKIIVPFTGSHSRYDQASTLRLANGTYLSACNEFGAVPEDSTNADIAVFSSTDLITWTRLSTVANFVSIGIYVPSMQVRSNGNIVMVFLAHDLIEQAYLYQVVSTDNGATWGTPENLYSQSGKYLNLAARPIFITSTGRWLVPFEVNTNLNHGSASGNYTGYMLYSDNEGVNWTAGANTITSPDNLCVESGMVQKTASIITRYFRNRSGVVYCVDSTDNGITWSAVYDCGLDADNSQAMIVKVTGGFIGCTNPVSGSRRTMHLFFSSDFVTWGNQYITETSPATFFFIEPSFYMEGNTLYIFYGQGNSSGSYSLKQQNILLSEYP